MKLSIVTTLYHSAPYVNEFHRRAGATANRLVVDDYEIIFVNDGSPDDSLNQAIRLTKQYSNVLVIDLSRNYGHHKAIMTGLSYAKGDQVFLIDSDLEEEPEWLDIFVKTMEERCCDVVYGVQINRKGGWFERWSGKLYYKVLCALLGIQLTENVVTARLMTRQFVGALLQHDEREMFLGGLFSLTGFEQLPMRVKKHSTSKTTYSFKRKIELLSSTVTSFSNVPLKLIFYLGLTISLIAGFYVVYLLLGWIFFFAPPTGWTSLVASIWLLGGMIICFLGIIGIYLSRIFIETKRRPYTIVKKIYGNVSQ
jgi:putative glycosyltransferase